MARVIIPDAVKHLSSLGSVLIPILQQLKVMDEQMMEFNFVVSLKERTMIVHKSSCGPLRKERAAVKH
jgi:hypothetical protein